MDAYLRQLAAMAEPSLHELVDDPAAADFILLTDVNDANNYAQLRTNPLRRQFPEKTFVFYEADYPIGYVPGIYPGMRAYFNGAGRYAGFPQIYTMARLHIGFGVHMAAAPSARRERPYLFSFSGSRSYWLRERLVAHFQGTPEVFVRDSTGFHVHDPNQAGKQARQQEFIELCLNSRFIACPSGFSPVTPRLFEAMFLGVAPVVLADAYLWPEGIDWQKFCVVVPEARYRDLVTILRGYGDRWYEMGQLARQEWEKHFAQRRLFNGVVAALDGIRQRRRQPEATFTRYWPLLAWRHRLWMYGRAVRHKLIGFRAYNNAAHKGIRTS